MPTGWGEIISDGANGNAIAHSVNRTLSQQADGPAHRCEFRTTALMPAFTVPDVVDVFSGGEPFTGNEESFGDFSFVDDGPVEETRYSYDETSDRAEYGLTLETVNGVHIWMLERCVSPYPYYPYIHTAWTAQWRTAFTTWNATHGSLTFAPMSKSDYIAWWRAATSRGHCSHQDWPSTPGSGNREDYHCWLDAAGSISCSVDIISQ